MIEFSPPRRLVMSWGEPADAGNRAAQSRGSITLEPVGEMERLIVHHDELPGPDALRGVADGWARVVSSLKSLLETGRALDTWEGH